jgi:Methyltransferase domain/C-methyltransferase C-terminal domain
VSGLAERTGVAAYPVTGACPSCSAAALSVFYEQPRIPIHSNVLVRSREEALSYPCGEMRLSVCGSCGFMTNEAFDPRLAEISEGYEESQGFSPVFHRYAESLASRWIGRYDLRGKQISEIGCGKGEFLALMCEAGECTGVGIDPLFVEGRGGRPSERLTFVNDYFSEQYGHLAGDALVCRHTLEHIHAPGDFLSMLRSAIGSRDTVVLFDVPDALRVLRECAFWDVYYEHCSYFTPGSLARAFRRAGFDVLDVELLYDGQYIIVEARPGAGDGEAFALEDSPEDVARAADEFRTQMAAERSRWKQTLTEGRAAGRRAVVWGAGSKGTAFLTGLGVTDEIEYVVDINPHKQGTFMAGTGQEIVGPRFLADYRPDLVVIMNPVYRDEIAAELAGLGLHPDLAAV